ncbi:SDR family NAD(P)-dependent oxidoreductase [Micromonospora carbonacea]|uniref:SDR family NAD(P)-dependent oxidoreductase n=1 Tax=Micromonospora carbonacea TaxID=47853 RepID=A0A7H8XNB5_9ACTN|nr:MULTISPECIES: SDR family NAD(P)-dependent oxidoreductase [Micromonospora]MBB5826555.1 NAD(P)-dependent dehydrogenase (short-subunit alcohol dehydrogenase family) [Micromonospora carbonacea]MDG4819492.1 SDR family NAD(P)-dependent oxidoreductase [Micromonospora sp. WMMD956]QLD26058.1 SDR family NAD(P)-dependent oxidoreductase [Micromonospora carbonacea]WFE55941.1 SDR family NAD(P)-dependent oxidoreductase [Micromonospora sp. WMMD712]
MTQSRAILLTGASSGTGMSSGSGKATALRLHRAGWPVYATGRNVEALADLADEGITVLYLDVNDEESMAAAVKRITDEHGAVGTLINNAAYSLNGTIGETPMDEVRAQFETNVFGLCRLTQLVLPGMREQGGGRIIMMSSIFGMFATPGRGYYQATKHALEAISDSLRLEVAPFGIKVVVLQPAPILGGFVPDSVADLGMDSHDNPALYRDFWEHFVDWHQAYRLSDNPPLRGKIAVRAENVAKVLETAVSTPNPRIRYRLGMPPRLLPKMRAMIGERGWEKFVRAFFPIP